MNELCVVEYDLTEEVYRKASQAATRGVRWTMIGVFAVFLLANAVLSFWGAVEDGATPIEARIEAEIIFVILLILLTVIFNVIWNASVKKYYRQQCTMYGTKRKCVIREAEIFEQTEKSSMNYSYENIKRILETQDYLVLTSGNRQPVYMVLIPKRLSDGVLPKDVRELILEKCTSAKYKSVK